MLKKLFIHEWRSFWKVPAGVCLFLIVYTLIGGLTFHTPLWDTENRLIQALLMLGSFSYFLALIAPAIVLVIYIALRFYRNLYTDEGYLMHTLPVHKWELIISKVLVAGIWNFIVGFVTLCSVLLVILLLATSTMGGNAVLADITEAFHVISEELFPLLREFFAIPLPLAALMLTGLMILSAFYSIMMIYGSVSIGHLWKKHPVAGSIISYMLLYFIMQIISTLLNTGNMLDLVMQENVMINASMSDTMDLLRPFFYRVLGQVALLSLLGIVLFYSVTEWIMKRRLNLD